MSDRSLLDAASDLRHEQAALRELCTDLRRKYPKADSMTPYQLSEDAVRMADQAISTALGVMRNARMYVRDQFKREEELAKSAPKPAGGEG